MKNLASVVICLAWLTVWGIGPLDSRADNAPVEAADTLVFGLDAKIPDGIPAASNSSPLKRAMASVLASLTRFNTDSQPVAGDLAKSWETSSDLTTYVFHLRPGVQWQSGIQGFKPTRGLTADDVIYTFDRFGNPGHPLHSTDMTHGGVFSYYQFEGFATLIDRVEAVNSQTVRFKLRKPSAIFPEVIAQLPFAITSREYGEWCVAEWKLQKATAEKAGTPLPWALDASRNPLNWYDHWPVGTGAYRVKDRNVGAGTLLLEATPAAPRGAFSQVLFKPIADLEARTSAVGAHQAQVAITPDPLKLDALRKQGVRIQELPTKNAAFITFHRSVPADVRGAASMALNRHRYAEAILGPTGRPLGSMLHPSLLPKGYLVPEVFKYHPDGAKAALSEAAKGGHGKRLTLVYSPAASAYDPDPKRYAGLIAEDLRAAGFEVRLATVGYRSSDPEKKEILLFDDSADAAGVPDAGLFGTHVSNGGASGEAILYGDNNTTLTGLDRLLNSTTSGIAAKPGAPATNYSGWSNPRYDELVEKIDREPNSARRGELVAEAERVMYLQGLPNIPLTNADATHVVSPSITGFQAGPMGLEFIAGVRKVGSH